MLKTPITALAVLALTAALSGCGSGSSDSDADVEVRVADQLVEAGLGTDAAGCFAEILIDDVGADVLKDVDFSSEEPPPALAEDLAAAAIRAEADCDIDPGALDRE